MKQFLFLFVLVIGLNGCASKKQQTVLFENIQVRYESMYNELGPNAFLINTKAELDSVQSLLELSPAKGMPDLSLFLEDRSLVLVYGGMRPSAGYRLHVLKLSRTKNELFIRTRLFKPGENCYVSTVITYPLQVVAIPKTTQVRLNLDLLESTQDCK
ncbi:MAG: protease complex subunit PrcB family protein [Bacteroidia bacterium]|jgi:hypothetical protein